METENNINAQIEQPRIPKLASIEKIHSIVPHPNPEVERLECAKIKEWPVVIPNNTYKEGDLVVFITIDSIVPKENPVFAFMERQKYRIWNARFKGAPSSGLVMKISDFEIIPKECSEGDNITALLNVTKYERPFDVSIGGKQKGNFPTDLISITDEDNALSYPETFNELEDGRELYITLKNDGSSTSFICNNGEYKACSRRFEMQENEGFPWTASNKYDLKNKMTNLGRNLAIQAEAIGPKLNGNRLGLKEIEIRLFNGKSLDTAKPMGYAELKELASQLGIPMVEEIMIIKYDKSIHTIEWFRNLADSLKWPTNGQAAEGLVVRPTIPIYSGVLRKAWSVKFINQNYKQE